jgi:hypothetical protein
VPDATPGHEGSKTNSHVRIDGRIFVMKDEDRRPCVHATVVAKNLGVTLLRVRKWIRAGNIQPARFDKRGRPIFAFDDFYDHLDKEWEKKQRCNIQ